MANGRGKAKDAPTFRRTEPSRGPGGDAADRARIRPVLGKLWEDAAVLAVMRDLTEYKIQLVNLCRMAFNGTSVLWSRFHLTPLSPTIERVAESCRGWQEGAGAQIAIDPAAVERAMCDAQHIGSIDGDGPERAHQDIPPSVARFVWRRDSGRCRVDGCRSARGLELHHLVHRADGGSHDASNIVLVCSACHLAHHRGTLVITGMADDLQVRRPGESAPAANVHDELVEITGLQARGTYVGGSRSQASMADIDAHVIGTGAPQAVGPGVHVGAASSVVPVDEASVRVGGAGKLNAAILRTQAKAALTGLGWKPTIAYAAVDAAAKVQGEEVTLERLIFDALRRCPAPRT